MAFDTPMQLTFDLMEGARRKTEGMDYACASRKELLEAARVIAAEVAQRYGEVTSDDVYAEMQAQGMHPESLGNAAGSVFIDRKTFRHTGEFRKSARVTNHARVIRVWELR